MTSERLSLLLQNGANRVYEQPNVGEARLIEENEALNLEVSRLRLRILELERAADTDPLVPVYNRRAFMREINRAQTVMSRYNISSTVIFFDLNDFKSINDRYGHSIGDLLLKKIGGVLVDGVRDCDMVARLGGDEFAVLLFKTDLPLARAKASTLSCRIADQHIEMPTGKVNISAAWGVAQCEVGESADKILDRADRSMYLAKRNI